MKIKGVDISKYQDDPNFDVLATKVNFVIIRAAAVKTKDPKLERNVAEAKRVGLPYGLFFAPIPMGLTDFQGQAYFHADLVAQYGSQIFPAFDLEVDGGLNKNDLGNWMNKYVKWFSCRSGITDLGKLMTYTRASWFDFEMPLTDTFWRTCLWLADWTAPADTIPLEWANHNRPWFYWQTGIYKPATDYGCPAPPYAAYGIDLDEFYGTETDFENLFGVKPHYPNDLPPPPVEIPKQVKVRANGTNIRNSPIVAPVSDIGDLTQGAVLDVNADAGQFWKVQAFVAKSVVDPVTPIPPIPPVQEYIVLHDWETNQPSWRDGVPEVFWIDPNDLTTPIPEDWQFFCYALNLPGITPKQHRQLYDYIRAFTNGPAGYDNPGGKLHCDFVNGRDLDAPPPFFDKPRVCGGAILRGQVSGNVLAIETMDGNKPPPLVWSGNDPDWDGYVKSVAEWAKAHYWLCFKAVTISNGKNYNFPQGNGQAVLIPLVTKAPVTVKLNTLVVGKPYPYVTKKV